MIKEFCSIGCEEDHYHIFSEWDIVDIEYEYYKERQLNG